MNDFNRGALPVPCLRLDHGFGQQWASVELGDGTGYVRLSDYEKVVAENAKLRSELESVGTAAYLYGRGDLEAENARLRELVKNALTYIEYEGCGVECPETVNSATLTSCDMCNRYETESCAYVIAQNAHELGIEVNDE